MSQYTRSPELAAVEVGGMTRSAFLLRGALAAGRRLRRSARSARSSARALAQEPAATPTS